MEEYRDAIASVLAVIQPATVRQLYYQLVNRGVVEKTEPAYNDVDRNLTILRRAGKIPFEWLADNTRWMRKSRSYRSLREMLESQQQFYRRALWDEQASYVEVWLEKDALAGVLFDITDEWDVPLMVTRGYASLSFLHHAAKTIKRQDKPTFLYYFGDLDPSGADIPRAVEEGIREFAPEADIEFERVAVTRKQIDRLNLPTRPTKATDSRSSRFEGNSVEVDAIEPGILRLLVREAITRHIDPTALEQLRLIEQQERATLGRVLDHLPRM